MRRGVVDVDEVYIPIQVEEVCFKLDNKDVGAIGYRNSVNPCSKMLPYRRADATRISAFSVCIKAFKAFQRDSALCFLEANDIMFENKVTDVCNVEFASLNFVSLVVYIPTKEPETVARFGSLTTDTVFSGAIHL